MGERKFKTEVKQLLDLMINSLYSNKDIFLRELVANAADAIDKARFGSLTDPAQVRKWEIRVIPDKTGKTLVISDNGIGMSEAEVIENIGTIAKSGTKAFLAALEEKKESAAPEMIGQFGVGFYSAFMVADKVELETRKAGEESGVRWISDGKDSYEIGKCDRAEIGTSVRLFLKGDAETYLENWKLSDIIRKYSDFIEYPIILPSVKVNDDKTETVTDTVVNSQKAIWLRKSSEITEEEYQSFYSHLSKMNAGKYLKAIHLSAEGVTEFKALLFLPESVPFNIFMPELQKKGLALYVKRVFITDECAELVPDYLRFLRGVVDSSDLPLNVSREILQQNPLLGKIQKAIVTKILAELKKMQENEPEAYAKFFKEFGKILKEGMHTDVGNQEKLQHLAMYETLNNEPGKLISLDDYVKAMKPDQKDIYFITGDSRKNVESNPALELCRSKGYDVLLMIDPIEEWVMNSNFQFDKKLFKSVAKGELELDGADKEAAEKKIEEAKGKYQALTDYLVKHFDAKLSEVRFTARLTKSPACLVGTDSSISPYMEKLFKAMNQSFPQTKRVLELNCDHPLIAAMAQLVGKEESAGRLDKFADLLMDQALLSEGSAIDDPSAFTARVTDLMTEALAGK
ncbi:MAG: molecular chaperone HtpG [Victivallaceae bacterium]|nr:molecular chaperone HtpG [Victivallaceae bacterium]